MKKVLCYLGVLLAMASFAISCSDDEKGPDYAKQIVYDATTIHVPYNGSVDLDTLIKLDTESAVGDLTYTITKQPFYRDATTDSLGVTLTAYELVGSVLKSKTDVRVPDTLSSTSSRTRTVLDGELKIVLTVLGEKITELPVKIVQTNKPAFKDEDAVISFFNSPDLTVNGDNRTYKTINTKNGDWTIFTVSGLFDVQPYDYSPERILLRACPDPEYIETTSAGAIRAGGDDTKFGTGDYLVAFYCSAKGADESDTDYQAREAAAYQAAVASEKNRIYINVQYVAANEAVGIVLNSSIIGVRNGVSFYRNTSLPAKRFVSVVLNNGDTIPYTLIDNSNLANPDASASDVLLAGNFSATPGDYVANNIAGVNSSADATYAGWYANVNAFATSTTTPSNATATKFPLGSAVVFYITHKDHFLEEGWTVKVESTILEAAPES